MTKPGVGKRILMLTHEYRPYPGGVARYCESLARAAVDHLGFEVTVLAPSHGSHVDDSLDQGINVKRFAGDVFNFKHRQSLISAAAPLLKQNFDIVHVADWPMILAFHAIKEKAAKASVVTMHGTDALVLSKSLKARWYGGRSALSDYQRICSNSRYTESLIGTKMKLRPGARKIVTPLGVDAGWFEPVTTESKAAFRRKVGADDKQVVLTVARVDRRKGQGLAIQAIGALPSALRNDVLYVMVGKVVDEAYAEELKQLAAQAGVQIVFAGRVEDEEVRAAYAAADVFALTADEVKGKVEGFGLVLLEAAAQGLPAVVTPLQGIPEVIADGVSGLIAGSKDIADIAKALQQLLQNDSQQKIDRLRCIEHARQFTWERCAELTYLSLLNV